MSEKEQVISYLMDLKGIGKEKAELIYDTGFVSIDKLKNAKPEELSKVEGIGIKTAENMLNQIQKTAEESGEEIEEKKSDTEEEKKKEKETGEVEKTEEQKEAEELEEEKVEKETEIVEEGTEYEVKKKPEIDDDLKYKLNLRERIKKRKPKFLRQEGFRYKRIPNNWRRPKGLHSKMRVNKKYRPNKARIGYRGPSETRGLHPSGFEEVRVENVNDLKKINPKKQAARIGATVGTKKRIKIKEKAKELDIRILNL
ncbi:MAG: 50S ribosomal protein L32e [Candidatus Thermoplasmatota archaeon]